MRLKLDDLPEKSKRLNPQLFAGMGAVGAVQRKQDSQPRVGKNAPAQQARQSRVAIRVTIIVCRHRLCDDDNSATGGTKALRDAVSETFQIDDGDKRIRFEYGQCETRGSEGCIIRIERYDG